MTISKDYSLRELKGNREISLEQFLNNAPDGLKHHLIDEIHYVSPASDSIHLQLVTQNRLCNDTQHW